MADPCDGLPDPPAKAADWPGQPGAWSSADRPPAGQKRSQLFSRHSGPPERSRRWTRPCTGTRGSQSRRTATGTGRAGRTSRRPSRRRSGRGQCVVVDSEPPFASHHVRTTMCDPYARGACRRA
eukprot:scaffold58900_cov66-Phaeocystis_antarctica.AAC.3